MTFRPKAVGRPGRGGWFPYIWLGLFPGFFFYIRLRQLGLLERRGMQHSSKERRLIKRALDIALVPVGWVLKIVAYTALIAALPFLGITAAATLLHPRMDRAEYEARRRRVQKFLREV